MSTLAEIEEAVPKLNAHELERLEAVLNELRQRRAGGPTRPASLVEFAGVLRLTEDPLAWQGKVRGEWR